MLNMKVSINGIVWFLGLAGELFVRNVILWRVGRSVNPLNPNYVSQHVSPLDTETWALCEWLDKQPGPLPGHGTWYHGRLRNKHSPVSSQPSRPTQILHVKCGGGVSIKRKCDSWLHQLHQCRGTHALMFTGYLEFYAQNMLASVVPP